MTARMPTRRLLWLVAGFLVWGSGFASLYGLQGLGCGLGWQPGVLRIVLGAILVAHLAVLACLAFTLDRAAGRRGCAPADFIWSVATWAIYAAAAATVFGLLPPLFLSACVAWTE